MTGLEIIRAPGTTAEQIADIIAEHCPPVTPEHCDKLSCRECWLAWLATGESETPRSASVLLPKGEGAPEKQVPLEWEQRYVTPGGIRVNGKRYSSRELMAYIGDIILIKYVPETVVAKTSQGRDLGELTQYQCQE